MRQLISGGLAQGLSAALLVACMVPVTQAQDFEIPKPTASVKVTVEAPDDLISKLEKQLTKQLRAVKGARVVADDEQYEIRVIGMPVPSRQTYQSYFLSVLVIAPQRKSLQHIEMLSQHLPETVPGKGPGGKTMDFPLSLPIGYLKDVVANSHRIELHFAVLADSNTLKDSCREIALRFDEHVLASQRELLDRLRNAIEKDTKSID